MSSILHKGRKNTMRKEEMEIDDITFSKIMNEEVTRVSKEIVNES